LNQIIENGIQKILVIKSDEDLSEEDIPENILELMIEEFEEQEPDPVEDVEENNSEEKKEKNDKKEEKEEPIEILTIDEKIEAANEKIDELHNSISYLSQKLKSYEVAVRDEIEAQRKEVIALENKMKDDKKKLAEEKKILKEKHKFAIRDLKNNQKESIRLDKAELKLLQKNLVKEKEDIMLLTNKGKLQLILEDYDKLQKLSDRYIDAQVAIKLDYPIFMAVSEEGGKDNSGEYVYVPDEDGNRVEDIDGNPIVKQDLVNYNISQEQLQKEFDKVPQNTWAIAEYFIKFAKEQNFKFWS
jgi:type I restriction enzyme M protein